MSYRFLVSFAALAGLTIAPLAAQQSRSKSSTVPAAADGHPDLSGIWTNATVTPMERPAQFSKLQITDAEATTFERTQAQDLKDEDGKSDGPIIQIGRASCRERV